MSPLEASMFIAFAVAVTFCPTGTAVVGEKVRFISLCSFLPLPCLGGRLARSVLWDSRTPKKGLPRQGYLFEEPIAWRCLEGVSRWGASRT